MHENEKIILLGARKIASAAAKQEAAVRPTSWVTVISGKFSKELCRDSRENPAFSAGFCQVF